MTITIIQTLIPHYWYYTKVGETFEVEESGTPGDFRITEGEHTGKHILKSDCREVKSILGERLVS